MKLVVDCECILMQRALELFLEEYIVDFNEADFIVSDTKQNSQKHVFLVENHLSLLFTKHMLLEALEEYNFLISNNYIRKTDHNIEVKISVLLDEFKQNLINVIKDHYE